MRPLEDCSKQEKSKADENTNKETVSINYEFEYFRLKKLEAENQELKDTIINMAKAMFNSFNSLDDVIKDIDRELKQLRR